MKQLMALLLVVAFLNNSCGNVSKEEIRIPDSSFKILSYQYIQDSSAKRNHTIERLIEFGKLINLHSIKGLKKSKCIRVWVWNWAKDSNYVVEIHYGGLKNNISLIQFGPLTKDSIEYIQIHQRDESIAPKLSWDSLFFAVKTNCITKLNVDRQPTGLTHMTSVQFEIIESDSYHFYQYYEPAYFRYIDSNANKIYSFLTHLNKQSGVNFYKADSSFATNR